LLLAKTGPTENFAAATAELTKVKGFCVGCTPALQPVTGTVLRRQIVFDEGQDTGGPDNFGAAFLDNIDVNGALVGHGATDASSSP
jgi:hypothetical protein